MDQKWSKITHKIYSSTHVWLFIAEKLSRTEASSLYHVKEHKILSQKQLTLFQAGSELILFRAGGAILHTPTNFWTTGDTRLKFYMVINIHKLFPKIEKN